MANKGLNDILTKLSNVFKHDMYVVGHRYCIGGPATDGDYPSKIFCVLEAEESKEFEKEFPEVSVVFFKDIKKAKKEPGLYIKTEIPEDKVEEIQGYVNKYSSIAYGIQSWKPLELTQDEIDTILTERNIVGISAGSKYVFAISKQLIPLVAESTIDDLSYAVLNDKSDRGGVFLILKYIHSMCVYYNFIYYLSLDIDEEGAS